MASMSKYLTAGSFKFMPSTPKANIDLLCWSKVRVVGVGSNELSLVADQNTSCLLMVYIALPANTVVKTTITMREMMPPETVL